MAIYHNFKTITRFAACDSFVRAWLLIFALVKIGLESSTMMQFTDVDLHIQQLSTEELGQMISQCERAIANDNAAIEDYEKFVICQQELANRTWS